MRNDRRGTTGDFLYPHGYSGPERVNYPFPSLILLSVLKRIRKINSDVPVRSPKAVGSRPRAGADLVRIVRSDPMPGWPTGRRPPPSPHRCPAMGTSHSIRRVDGRMPVVGLEVAARIESDRIS